MTPVFIYSNKKHVQLALKQVPEPFKDALGLFLMAYLYSLFPTMQRNLHMLLSRSSFQPMINYINARIKNSFYLKLITLFQGDEIKGPSLFLKSRIS